MVFVYLIDKYVVTYIKLFIRIFGCTRIEFMMEFFVCLYIMNHKINSVATCPKQQTLRDKQISSSNLCASGLDGATSFVDVTLEPVPM